jgi:hypothetical protein
MAKREQIPVTRSALVQRLNRALAKDDKTLRANRREHTYMLIDLNVNGCLDRDVDLEGLGRELNVLAEWEKLEK